jgi:uncharacterized protein (DUF488 family)
MPACDLFSIGHSNMAAERFIALLHSVGVTAVADVRSIPGSRRFPWFSKRSLAGHLERERIAYALMGDTLGGRPLGADLFRGGIADYEAMAMQPQFQGGIDRLIDVTAHARVCMMCAEREPLECHRCLLVARSLAGRGLTVGHILADGTIEAHTATEQRLLQLHAGCRDLFATGHGNELAAAYRRQAHRVAYRQKVPAPPSAQEYR